MKPIVFVAFTTLCFSSIGKAEDSTTQLTKFSQTKLFKPADEVRAFYSQLIQSNDTVKKQYDALVAKSKDYGDGVPHVSDPQVVEWVPGNNNWNINQHFDSQGRFLVIQQVGFSRDKHSDSEIAVVAEFSVAQKGTTVSPGKKKKQADLKLAENDITVNFLGFRNLQVSPINSEKPSSEAEQLTTPGPVEDAGFKKADTELDEAYNDVLSRFKNDEMQKAQFKSAQKAWKAFRESDAWGRAYIQSRGQTPDSNYYVRYMTELTEQRTEALTRFSAELAH